MIVKRLFGIGIILFWCLMNILLVRRYLSAPPPPLAIQSAGPITETMDEWWGVFYRGEKIGYAAQRIDPMPDGYAVHASSRLRLNLMGTLQNVSTRLEMVAAPTWELRRFDFDLQSNGTSFKARGSVAGKKLFVEVESGGYKTEKELALAQPPYLLSALKPYVASQNYQPGKEQLFPTFDPTTLSQQVTTVVVEGREPIEIGGRKETALRIRQRFKGISVVSWVDGKGRTLKEETASGLSLVRQRPEEAPLLAGAKSLPLDLIAQTSIPVAAPIENAGEKRSLRLRLAGFEPGQFSLGGGRQRLSRDILEIGRENPERARSYPIPQKEARFASYLQSTAFLQSDHPEVRALVREVLGGETDALRAVERLRRWVFREIAKAPTVSIPNALEVLKTRKGDCNEHTVLFNAMARAAGIPAKTVVGLVYLRGAFYYHAWSEVWLGEWVSVDPVLNQFPADVTHVRFLEGEIDRQIDIIQLIGNLKIEVLEAS